MVDIHIVFGDPPDLTDRYFCIFDDEDREYFLKWVWKFIETGSRFGVFPNVESDLSDS